MTERSKALEYAVAKLLRRANQRYHRVDNYRCFKCGQIQNSRGKGWPDFFVYWPHVYAVECKVGKGRLNPDQFRVKKNLEGSGIKYILCRDTVDELLKYLTELGEIY